MRKVAIFGNAGGGKSTLAKRLADVTGLPLFPVDRIKYQPGGKEIPHDEYLEIHSGLLNQYNWIIEGFGCIPSAWERFSAADTLIYIDFPLLVHASWVTKRLLKGPFVTPQGWPENSPLWRGTLNSYRVLWLCHRKLTPAYRKLVAESAPAKTVYHLKTPTDIQQLVWDIRQAYQQ